MKAFSNKIYIAFIMLAAMILATACEDKFDYRGEGYIPEGHTDMSLTVGYSAFTPALKSRASGDAIKSINSLWVLLFDTEGDLVEKHEITKDKFALEENDRPDGTPSSEVQTGRAKFNLTLPNGKWRIYAVANHDLSGFEGNMQQLQKIKLTWQDDVALNAQMFGFFTNSDGQSAADMPASDVDDFNPDGSVSGTSFTAPVVVVAPGKPLHAWVRRAASKLTVAFNTDKLKDNVRIYIKSIAIKDIAKECYLGFQNCPGRDTQRPTEGISDDLIPTGEVFYLNQANESQKWEDGAQYYTGWYEINNGAPVVGMHTVKNPADKEYFSDKTVSPEDIERLIAREHTEKVPALYFYENNQGKGKEGTVTDKRQDVHGNNSQITYPAGVAPGGEGWKDGMKDGTWVEVEAYYECNDSIKPSRGPIKYRFMLGKDHITDYNVERNYHYQLTLTFNGYANDVDFHIDYKESGRPGLTVDPVVYVSYLYNQSHATPVRAVPKLGYKLQSLTAVIVDNEWRPYNGENDVAYNKETWDWQTGGGTEDKPDGKNWFKGDGDENRKLDSECASNCHYGWLSLRHIDQVSYNMGSGASQNLCKEFVKRYFTPDELGGPLGKREYDFPSASTNGAFQVYGDSKNGTYYCSLEEEKLQGQTEKEKTYIINVPLYTRAKTLDPWAVYSGANPFNNHYRYARVKYTAVFVNEYDSSDTYPEIAYSDVLQARRIENPRAIYRKHNSSESFDVEMMYSTFSVDEIPAEGRTVYETLISRGPWSATIEVDPHGIVRLKSGSQVITGVGNKITGRTGTPVKFTYTPNTKMANGESAGAIVTVRYHNNSCIHKIIIRQGYGPVQMRGGGTLGAKWSTFNIYDQNTLCVSPLAGGSLFRRYLDISYPIKESNNKRENFGIGQDPGETAYWIHGKEDTNWDQIPAYSFAESNNEAFGTFSLNNPGIGSNTKKVYRAPDMKECLEDIIDNNDVNFAFGIAYADGASTTQTTTKAFSFYDPDNNGGNTEMRTNGVRAVIAYSLKHGDNILFSLGSASHPRRKSASKVVGTPQKLKVIYTSGYMRYGSLDCRIGYDGYRAKNDVNNYRPMAYNLPSQYGAIYWVRNGWGKHNNIEKNYLTMDFNYGNYMTNVLINEDVFTGEVINNDYSKLYSDAVPIRPVYNE